MVDSDGNQLGIMSLASALRLAEEKEKDLVEIAPQAKPPVCRLMDYGKYKYEQSKREKEARKKQHIVSIKEIKLRPGIEEHDFLVKANNVARFLKDAGAETRNQAGIKTAVEKRYSSCQKSKVTGARQNV
ncbi:MAG: Translation initiation factor IF-3 [Desulfotomaculum sp. 46_80]|nr:MAG: Translation initiation factor IF-3 [Desulfotomaculum sp. 46_80]